MLWLAPDHKGRESTGSRTLQSGKNNNEAQVLSEGVGKREEEGRERPSGTIRASVEDSTCMAPEARSRTGMDQWARWMKMRGAVVCWLLCSFLLFDFLISRMEPKAYEHDAV